jgi:hypothetical protein
MGSVTHHHESRLFLPLCPPLPHKEYIYSVQHPSVTVNRDKRSQHTNPRKIRNMCRVHSHSTAPCFIILTTALHLTAACSFKGGLRTQDSELVCGRDWWDLEVHSLCADRDANIGGGHVFVVRWVRGCKESRCRCASMVMNLRRPASYGLGLW